jgi:hypothetical protein
MPSIYKYHLFGLINGADSTGQTLNVNCLFQLSDVSFLQSDNLLQVLLVVVVNVLKSGKEGFAVTTKLVRKNQKMVEAN